MNNLMIDLETMGTGINAPIISIGAVFFDPNTGNIGSEFYSCIFLTSSMKSGGIPDGSTILWWINQSVEAKNVMFDEGAITLQSALSNFSKFVCSNCPASKVQVWGNGSTFDNAVLRASYQRLDMEEPWRWYNDRDVRTIVEIGRAIGIDPKKSMPFNGEVHNALADAKHQAAYVSAIYQRLIIGNKS